MLLNRLDKPFWVWDFESYSAGTTRGACSVVQYAEKNLHNVSFFFFRFFFSPRFLAVAAGIRGTDVHIRFAKIHFGFLTSAMLIELRVWVMKILQKNSEMERSSQEFVPRVRMK